MSENERIYRELMGLTTDEPLVQFDIDLLAKLATTSLGDRELYHCIHDAERDAKEDYRVAEHNKGDW